MLLHGTSYLSDSTSDSGREQSSSTSPNTPTLSTSTEAGRPEAVRLADQSRTYPYKALAGSEYVPALPIRLRSLDGVLQPSALAIVDSGADRSTFPTMWADSLGIKLHESWCEKSTAETAGGTVVCWIYPPGITALIDGREHRLKASFCEGLEVPLLGRKDLFNAYRITFDQRAKTFTLDPYPPRDWRNEGPLLKPR
jgi:hypothetical protein